MNSAGLIFDDSIHYLDHLAPFCSLLNWPLIACDSEVADLARTFYPELHVVEKDPLNLKLPQIIATCDTKPLIYAAFPGQKTQTLWLPHGHSDKAFSKTWLQEEDVAFDYARLGNFRWEYYVKHLPFYETIWDIPENSFLYAPTWDDFESRNSFWKAFPDLAKNLPSHLHLAVKLHPNTWKQFAPELEILKGRYNQKNIHFLPNLPPIYPLLSKCLAYIGDMSSVGYDFLTLDRPLFFLNADAKNPLHRCGQAIDPKTFDFSIQDSYSKMRKELYQKTFHSAVGERTTTVSKSLSLLLQGLTTIS